MSDVEANHTPAQEWRSSRLFVMIQAISRKIQTATCCTEIIEIQFRDFGIAGTPSPCNHNSTMTYTRSFPALLVIDRVSRLGDFGCG